MTDEFLEKPLSEILQNRDIFEIFDEEFQKASWLDVTALLNSDSNIRDLYKDGTVSPAVLDQIVGRIRGL